MSLYSPIFPNPLTGSTASASAPPVGAQSNPGPVPEAGNHSVVRPQRVRPHYETWYWKLNDPTTGNALWLRLSTLATENGFQQVAEAWAILFEATLPPSTTATSGPSPEVRRTALKQTFDIGQLRVQGSASGDVQIALGPCTLSDQHSSGKIECKGSTIEWNLAIRRGAMDQFSLRQQPPPLPDLQSPQFNLIPKKLRGLVPSHAFTVSENLIYDGTCTLNGKTFKFEGAHGMLGHHGGKRMANNWLWAHASGLVNEKGEPISIVAEAIRGRSRLPLGIVSPEVSAVYLVLKDQEYTWNRIRDQGRIRSTDSLNGWEITIDDGDLQVSLKWKAESSWFAGVTYVDTNGSQAYCANTKVANFTLHWYWKGKIEGSAFGHRNAAFERVTRTRPEYVPILIE